MLKKMMLLALSVGALVAFAAPAVAQANVELTNNNGTTVAENSEITAVSMNVETTTAAGTIYCPKITLHGNVAKNDAGGHVTINNLVVTTETCRVTVAEIPITMTDPTFGTITIDTNGGTMLATFRPDYGPPFNIACHLEGGLEFTFVSGTDVLNMPGSKLTKGAGFPEGCPKEGTIEGSFTLENAAGPVTIDKL